MYLNILSSKKDISIFITRLSVCIIAHRQAFFNGRCDRIANIYKTLYWKSPAEHWIFKGDFNELRAGRYNPNQPRDKWGKWCSIGISINTNHKSLKMNKTDREILEHEFNSKYHQFDHKEITHARFYGDHLYIFDSLEYGSYNIWGKVRIKGNEEFIKYCMEEYDINDYNQ